MFLRKVGGEKLEVGGGGLGEITACMVAALAADSAVEK